LIGSTGVLFCAESAMIAVFPLLRVQHGEGAYCGGGCGVETDRSDPNRLALHVFISPNRFHLLCDSCAQKFRPDLFEFVQKSNRRLTVSDLLRPAPDLDFMIVPLLRAVLVEAVLVPDAPIESQAE
jgi:hypothetical protein